MVQTMEEKEALTVDWIVTNSNFDELEVLVSGETDLLSPTRLELFDSASRMVKYWLEAPLIRANAQRPPISLHIAGITSGIYNLKITNGRSTAVRRVMIDR